jgi:hypothetical protein
MHLFDISFPVYAITKTYRKIWEEMNVVYIETESGTYVLDNKNIDGNTIGERRLKIKNSELYIPRKVYYNISQFLHSKYNKFIDSKGNIFSWKKSFNVPLKYHKVAGVIQTEEDCIIHLKDIIFPQKVNCRIAYVINYVGVLHTEYGYVLYEYCENKKKDTYRKI